MKSFIFYFAISAVFQISLCYDIELEGTVKLGNDFMKQLLNKGTKGKKAVELKDEKPARLATSMRRVFNASELNGRAPTTTTRFLQLEDDEIFFLSVADVISNSGVQQLKNIIKYLSYKCDVKKDVNVTTRSIIADYVDTFKEKAKELSNNYLLLYDLDKEYSLLNLVEISSVLFYRKEKEILKVMLDATSKSSFDLNADALAKKIHAHYRNHRSNGMHIVCVKYKKCRDFPGFSDNLADLINAILKLPTTRLLSFFDIVNKILLSEVKFIDSLFESKVLDVIAKRFQTFEAPKIRMFLNSVKSIIEERYKLIYNPDEDRLKRTKAARILLDILDKSFYTDGKDLQMIEFETIIKMMEQWSLEQEKEAELGAALKNFLQHILSTLKHEWEDGVANEINTLLEILLLGQAKDDFGEAYLLNKGSLFVRNKLVHSDPEIGLSDDADC